MSHQHQYDTIKDHFDTAFYLKRHPDVASAGIDPITHYMQYGWREGRQPTEEFDPTFYLATYSDVTEAGLEPFYHYVVYGHNEGRLSRKLLDITRLDAKPQGAPYLAIKDYFDVPFYLRMNPDVAAARIDPIAHYIDTGWREGRDPTPHFSSSYYARVNPDVIAASMNPFHHYVIAGRHEGRLPKLPFSEIRAVIEAAHDLQGRIANPLHARLSPVPVTGIACTHLMSIRALETAFDRIAARRVVASFSHDDYMKNFGGLQLRVSDEQVALNQAGAAYIHFAPAAPLLHILNVDDLNTHAVSLTIDGTHIGVARARDVVVAFGDFARRQALEVTMVLHSVLGHSVSFVTALAEQTKAAKSLFWIHDFSSLCTNYSLLRNNLTFCELPPPECPVCQICAFGNTRQETVRLIGTLFDALNPVVIAPSQVAMEFWRRHAPYQYRATVVGEHAKSTMTDMRAPLSRDLASLRVAHVGAPATHKGWLEFLDLTARFATDHRYSFFLFSSAAPHQMPASITHVTVSVNSTDRNAMIDALISNDIDVVVHWTLCYETYSFTALESLLAGTFVIARTQSGNAAEIIRQHKAGALLQHTDELNDLFSSGELVDTVTRYRAK